MNEFDYSAAFAENEKEANLYAARCMRVFAVVVTVIWAMNLLHLFIVPPVIMAISAVGGIVLFLLPTLLLRLLDRGCPRLKLYILLCCILGITLLSTALPKHAVMAWPAPIILGCHYYSRRFSYSLLIVSVVCMAASLLLGIYVGEWDSNLLYALDISGARVITGNTLRRGILFYILPRSLILCGLSTICTMLSDRTRRLLERQVKDSAEKQQIASELRVATQIQTSMLPCIFPAFPERTEFDIYATMNPAKEVGGDFYDFFLVDEDHLAVVIADVSGKGVPAALFMVIAKTLIKDHAQQGIRPEEVFTEVNRLLCEANDEGMFVTAWMGVLELSTGHLAYVNAGHNPPLLRQGSEYRFLRTRSGFILAGMEEMRYRSASLELVPGDSLYLYTDGVTEATNAAQQLYGDKRLLELLNSHVSSSPEVLLQAVKDDIDAFVGDAQQVDDITMLGLRYIGPAIEMSNSGKDEI